MNLRVIEKETFTKPTTILRRRRTKIPTLLNISLVTNSTPSTQKPESRKTSPNQLEVKDRFLVNLPLSLVHLPNTLLLQPPLLLPHPIPLPLVSNIPILALHLRPLLFPILLLPGIVASPVELSTVLTVYYVLSESRLSRPRILTCESAKRSEVVHSTMSQRNNRRVDGSISSSTKID